MALINDLYKGVFGPKPIKAKGTAKAFAAGDAMFKRTGINPHLKAAMKKAILAERQRAK